MKKSLTLVEVLVGVALILIVFLGIFAAFRLGLVVIEQGQKKITATAIALGEIEKIRNLPYKDVGTIGATLPYALGILEPETKTILNGTEFKIERKIKFISDSADGIGKEDPCNLDYKRAEIKVSFSKKFFGEVKMVTDIAPKDKAEEVQACQVQPGGVLSVFVFDAFGNPVSSPLIEIFNPLTNSLVDSASPFDGSYDFPLASSTYKVVVSKPGYSQEKTYSIDEIAIPQKPNPIVFEGGVTQVSFSIDKLSSFLIKTLSPWGQDFFSDSFSNESKISEKENVVVSNDQVSLATSNEGYLLSGFLFSIEISPQNLISWDKFSFSDTKPESTDLRYQIYFASGTEWMLIPESALPGNSAGFNVSPVDLSSLPTSTYSKLKLKAIFSTNSSNTTPVLYDWQVSFITSQPTPIGNVTFNLRGEKLIGYDANENPVYKFSTTTISNSQGQKEISNLEWDKYHISIPPETGLDFISSDPQQPIALSPNTNLEVKLYLDSQNSLLVTVQDFDTLQPIFSATTTLKNSNFQKTQYTNERGQTIFIPLDSGNYSLLVEAAGYYSTSTSVFVSGDKTITIKLKISD